MPLVTFKFTRPEALTIYASFEGQPRWEDLASKITQLFNIPSNRVGVAFINEVEKVVMLTNEQGLQNFYKSLAQSSEEIKLVVQDTQAADDPAAVTASWSLGSNISDLSDSDDDELCLLLWVLNMSDTPFSVSIGMDKTVDRLKQAITERKKHSFAAIDYHTLKLWKLSPPIYFSEIGERLRQVQSPEEITSSTVLNSVDKLSQHFSSPLPKHIHIVVECSSILNDPSLSSAWLALKNNSSFYTSAGKESQTPLPGSILCLNDPSQNFSVFERVPISSIYIRECYITWFNLFCDAVANEPNGKFALSSTPGCGKTFATNFILKMVTITPSLQHKDILYQFKTSFLLFRRNNVTSIEQREAERIALSGNTFYILDGCDAVPLSIATCLTLFISSPWSNRFKCWHTHAQVSPWYFPVWSLDELQHCRRLCYPKLDATTVSNRYRQYGGVARYVLWTSGTPTSLEAAINDVDARRSIRSVYDPSIKYETSHMLLHIAVDEHFQFTHMTLASRHVGVLLFSRYFEEMLDILQSMLESGDALAGYLFECYGHFLFEHGRDEPLLCRPLDTDGVEFSLSLHKRNIEAFEKLPGHLLNGTYYVPLAAQFPVVDALTNKATLQFTVAKDPIKDIRVVEDLVKLYGGELRLVFIVPEQIAVTFKKQKIVEANGKPPINVKQFVTGLPLGIDTSIIDTPTAKRRRLSYK